jgi:hypothetical protein
VVRIQPLLLLVVQAEVAVTREAIQLEQQQHQDRVLLAVMVVRILMLVLAVVEVQVLQALLSQQPTVATAAQVKLLRHLGYMQLELVFLATSLVVEAEQRALMAQQMALVALAEAVLETVTLMGFMVL